MALVTPYKPPQLLSLSRPAGKFNRPTPTAAPLASLRLPLPGSGKTVELSLSRPGDHRGPAADGSAAVTAAAVAGAREDG